MRHGRLIKQLGGYREVAHTLRLDPSTVFRWTVNGIPTDRWASVIRLAQRHNLNVTWASLDAGRPKARSGLVRKGQYEAALAEVS